MKAIFETSIANPFMAKGTNKPANFYCIAPSAESVYLVGDFNAWNPTSHPMRRRDDGLWFIEVLLKHGHHQYRLLVDGKPVLDSKSGDEGDEQVSPKAVS
jgi:1,4-alpha-glucan branching enzyme